MSDDSFIEIGLVGRPHGLRGEVGVDFWAESPDLLRGTLWLRPGRGAPRPHTVAAVRRHQGRPLVLFEGIADRSAAETLRGMHVLVPKDRLPEPAEDEVYLHELLGLRVLLHDAGTVLGTLDDVQMPGGQEVWSIRTADGKEVLLPAVEEFVASIDLDAREVRITPPPGLIELYLEAPEKSAARKPDADVSGPSGPGSPQAPGIQQERAAHSAQATAMHFSMVTLFPEFFDSPLSAGLMAKARESGTVDFSFRNPRDATADRHRTVDDRPYGGGPGMVMLPEPLAVTLRGLREDAPKARILMMAPRGRRFTQQLARELAREEHVAILCGRYEGFDARIEELFDIEPVCVGDFVLNGGETAALNVIEAVARLVPGFMGKEESGEDESFSEGLLEYPHYTRPEVFEGLPVPDVLRSGDHGRIAAWRREQSLAATLRLRPELLPEAPLTETDMTFLRHKAAETVERAGRNLHCALVHYPVLNKEKKSVAVSLTNLDIHDIGRCSCTYGLGGYYIVTPIEDQRRLLDGILRHWTEGPGLAANPDRGEALGLVRGADTVQDAVDDITRRTGQRPLVIATSARGAGDTTVGQVRSILAERPVLLLFGTGHGLSPHLVAACDGTLRPVRWMDGYNHLSVRTAAAIIMDRILGDCY